MKTPDVIIEGKANGDGMLVHYKTAKGTDIFGLGVPNTHVNTDWDLGPTWCYLILGKKITLIDTGRFGNLEHLKALLNSIDKDFSDIDRVIPTHSHEDHDGNLAEILSLSQAELCAHEIYSSMISYHPHITEDVIYPELPGSCRLCVMPEEFRKECLPYHQRRSSLHIDCTIKDGQTLPEEDISFVFTPGHSADSICTVLEDEVIFTGDTLLPDITPHPSRAYSFQVNHRILPEEYAKENNVYGLLVYIKSLKKIASLATQPIEAAFPAHRLFYKGKFNLMHSSSHRATEIIQFHIDRCQDILTITDGRPTSLDDIAAQHFDAELLVGGGKELAHAELIAHIEVMKECGDVCWVGENEDMIQHTGSNNYLDVMKSYLH